MRVSTILRTLSKLADKLQVYSNYQPTPLSLKAFTVFGQAGVEKQSFEFLRHEIPVRLANIMREIYLLPDRLLRTPSAKAVISLYEQSFDDIIVFEKMENSGNNVLTSFSDTLNKIRDRHANVVETMAQGIVEMKEQYGVDALSDHQLQYFLNRFFISRISIRMLINQHVSLFGHNLNQNRHYVGCIDQKCDPLFILTDAYANASRLCKEHFGVTPSCRVVIMLTNSQYTVQSQEPNELLLTPEAPQGQASEETLRHIRWLAARMQLVYVPNHLFYIFFEVMKNAMRAVVESRGGAGHSSSDPLPPLEVLLAQGKEDLTVKISDRGVGILHHDLEMVFNYTYSTAAKQVVQSSEKTAPKVTPMAGYGYGLPISRLYARYFNGDLRLSSVQGYGTDAFIYLKRSATDTDELLPVFNHTSASRYNATVLPGSDWSKSKFKRDKGS